MNDPLPRLIAGFDQLAAMMRPVCSFYKSFHGELMREGFTSDQALTIVTRFMVPFAEKTWANGST